jgi:hypothetical protein
MNNGIVYAGLGLLAAYFFFGAGATQKENYFKLKDGRSVPESELPELGYVLYMGKWVKRTDLEAALIANNLTTVPQSNTQSAWNVISTILGAGMALTDSIINNVEAAKDAKIQEILNKYTLTPSPYYTSTFPYTLAVLKNKTLDQLKLILNGNFNV